MDGRSTYLKGRLFRVGHRWKILRISSETEMDL